MEDKFYSVKLAGEEKGYLVQLSRSALEILQNGGFVLGRRHNTSTGEITDLGFHASQVTSLQETKAVNA